MMTAAQMRLARHALGLDGRRTKSYRNFFTCGEGHADWAEWRGMVTAGLAKWYNGKMLPMGGDDLFKLTVKGAKATLLAGESLDREDFADA